MKQAINQNELLHEDDDMMAFKHTVTQKNGKKFRVTQIQLYKDGKVWREMSNAIINKLRFIYKILRLLHILRAYKYI